MRLTPTEQDRLLLFGAAQLARARRARGLRLNVPEATALIADTVCEAARDGLRLAEAVEAGRRVLRADEVLPGVPDIVTEIQVEAVFDDGTRLAVVTEPFRGAGSLGDTAPGAALPREEAPARVLSASSDNTAADDMPAGDTSPDSAFPDSAPPNGAADAAPDTPAHRESAVRLSVVNTSAVPVSVTSHFHFFEVNRRLAFERALGYGMRLDIPAGSSTRFEPGVPVEVGLVPIGGARIAIGFSGLVDGPLDTPGARAAAFARAKTEGYAMHPAHAPSDPRGDGGANPTAARPATTTRPPATTQPPTATPTTIADGSAP